MIALLIISRMLLGSYVSISVAARLSDTRWYVRLRMWEYTFSAARRNGMVQCSWPRGVPSSFLYIQLIHTWAPNSPIVDFPRSRTAALVSLPLYIRFI